MLILFACGFSWRCSPGGLGEQPMIIITTDPYDCTSKDGSSPFFGKKSSFGTACTTKKSGLLFFGHGHCRRHPALRAGFFCNFCRLKFGERETEVYDARSGFCHFSMQRFLHFRSSHAASRIPTSKRGFLPVPRLKFCCILHSWMLANAWG
jgi:hypothetical protein